MASTFYVEFVADNPERLENLQRVVDALGHAKWSEDWQDNGFWLGLFDDESKSHFWWPSEAEREEWSRQWFATPVEKRHADPSLARPWDFGSMIEAFRNGDYGLIGLERRDAQTFRLAFEPYGDPYGGTGCMVALIESFGFRVTARVA